MGFTNVAWEARSTEQLARDLTDGPGPMSTGQAGAAWVRVANELADVVEEYAKVVDKVRGSFVSEGAEAAAQRLDDFGNWLRAVSLSAAGNGQRAEEAAIANGVAVMAMPTVAEAVEARVAHDVMSSLAAYNGAVLHGRFAELDDAATADQAAASTVMYAYEEACGPVAAPWEQPMPPSLTAKANSAAAGDENTGGDAATGGAGAGASSPAPLAPFRSPTVASSRDAMAVKGVNSGATLAGGSSGAGGLGGGGYGPMAAHNRGDSDREHQSTVAAGALAGGGEASVSPLHTGDAWLPSAQHSDAPFMVSKVSWGADTAGLDELATPLGVEGPSQEDEPTSALERVARRWASTPVIGADKGLTL